jgi:hypothetical protein
MIDKPDSPPHQWKFFRAGGFDQVLLESGEDLLALPQLDNKLWSSLSCPIKGIEFDQRTLQLIDSDNDGHIRAPEILAAVTWAGHCLKAPRQLISGDLGVELAAIDTSTEEGARVFAAARTLLTNLGKADHSHVTIADCCDSGEVLAQARFNGDGVITAASTDDPCLQQWFTVISACLGSVADQSGEPGINGDLINLFSAEAAQWLAWHTAKPAMPSLADESLLLWISIKAKIDDYFLRCQMAAFDERAVTIMGSSDEQLAALAPRNLPEAVEAIAALPLAAITSMTTLELSLRVNPAWQTQLSRLRTEIIAPLLGDDCTTLSEERWQALKSALEPCEAWWHEQPTTPVSALGSETLAKWQAQQPEAALLSLVEQDIAMKPAFDAIVEVERLCRYCRDLLPFANNFVSFRDFYTGRGKATFQAGSLYLDGRSFELCVVVTDVAKHAILASLSRVYLAYCDCVRNGGEEKLTIAAAITNGDSDQLLVGRNGVFYDRQGRDWDATIVRIVEHPISIRQAFWDPYKRIGKMAGEALQKIAAARSKANEEKAVTELLPVGAKKPEAKPPEPAFDVGKFAGIFAAIGLAIGAIGTAVASILTGFFKLPWWQMPLVFAGLMLLVSGPSILLAWLKLRQRNLGRLLDANGWAVNTRATINIPFGTSLTDMARLPNGAIHSLFDPFAEKKIPWKRWLLFFVLLALAVLGGAWRLGYLTIR